MNANKPEADTKKEKKKFLTKWHCAIMSEISFIYTFSGMYSLNNIIY